MKKKISILGAGESGTGAALLAQQKGYEVFVSDAGTIKPEYKKVLSDKGIAYEEGGHTAERILAAEEIIKSPGINPAIDIVKEALKKGIAVIDEIEFASRYTTAKFVAITGTNGKTTTTLLTYHLFKEAGLNVALAGNVGHSLAAQLCERDFDWVVLELSSFQIDGLKKFHPHIAIILNITPDHLDRYNEDINQYAAAKMALINNMSEDDYLIYYLGSEILRAKVAESDAEVSKIRISHFDSTAEDITIGAEQLKFPNYGLILPTSELPLKGMHNNINMASAVMAALKAGISNAAITEHIKSFQHVPHRMEFVATIKGVTFINDSKATNVDAVYYALETFKQPIVWIAGGIDKGNNYNELEPIRGSVKSLICLGKDNAKLKAYYKDKIADIAETAQLTEAVRIAFQKAEPGDVVLLSPACASFDLFKNYEDRGDQFKAFVKELKAELGK
jgi:UDP-N-acetylmuramoylalanine--D-glutamate ligase